MDCTFCLDCIHACPHENVGIIAEVPGRALWRDTFRSGIGRFRTRIDIAALIVVLTFGAYMNAAGMVAPILELRDRWASLLPARSEFALTTACYLLGLLVVPGLLVGTSAMLSRALARVEASWLEVATRFAYALVPIGFSMWLAHYSFHFLANWDAFLPAIQRFLGDHGTSLLGEPEWIRACCRAVADWLPRLEILFLDFGFLLSLYVAYRIALSQTSRPSRAVGMLAPWAILLVVLFAAGVWIVLQPMQMRGTLPAVG
jgi:hypothetical protein